MGFYCTDENLGSISSQFIFFHDEFRVGAWEMFLSQLNVLHWCSPVSSVGKDDWNIEHILRAKHILHS